MAQQLRPWKTRGLATVSSSRLVEIHRNPSTAWVDVVDVVDVDVEKDPGGDGSLCKVLGEAAWEHVGTCALDLGCNAEA